MSRCLLYVSRHLGAPAAQKRHSHCRSHQDGLATQRLWDSERLDTFWHAKFKVESLANENTSVGEVENKAKYLDNNA